MTVTMPDDIEVAWQVVDLQTGAHTGEHADQALPIASIAKVPLLLIACREADAGRLDLTQRVELQPDGRRRGTTGVSAMRDPVTLSLQDAAYLALTISDNAAADTIWDSLTPELIHDHLRAMDLDDIHLVQPMRDAYDDIAAISAPGSTAATNTATPAALTRMLHGIWNDVYTSPEHSRWIRDLMERQVWHERIAPAFPAPDITVAAKSGTLGPFRNEIAVITYPEGQHYAAAILTNALTAHPSHRTDILIGDIAKHAVRSLRRNP